MGIAYNPNDELRAIVQRKQHEVKSLLTAHSSKDDPLQVCTMRAEGEGERVFGRVQRTPQPSVRLIFASKSWLAAIGGSCGGVYWRCLMERAVSDV